MRIYSSGYSERQFNTRQLRECAEYVARRVHALRTELQFDAVVVTGKSGLSVGFAAQMAREFPMIVVRKAGERSHGLPIEGPDNLRVLRYIIMDDFIDSGSTVETIVTAMRKTAEQQGEPIPMCVGVLQYSPSYRVGGNMWDELYEIEAQGDEVPLL